jgi:glycopeptidolipid biosynthesis protein
MAAWPFGEKLGLLVRIDASVESDLLEQANRQALQESERLSAAFLAINGQVFQHTIDHPDVKLACYGMNCSQHPVQEAREIASSIQRPPVPLSSRLFTFGSLQMRLDEACLLDGGESARLDGWASGRRYASWRTRSGIR